MSTAPSSCLSLEGEFPRRLMYKGYTSLTTHCPSFQSTLRTYHLTRCSYSSVCLPSWQFLLHMVSITPALSLFCRMLRPPPLSRCDPARRSCSGVVHDDHDVVGWARNDPHDHIRFTYSGADGRCLDLCDKLRHGHDCDRVAQVCECLEEIPV